MAFDVEIVGLDDLEKKNQQMVKDLTGAPMIQAMRESTLDVMREARILAPVDTGRLRASITPQVSVDGETVKGVVGSNVTYAPFMEFGTKPHFPPISALEPWARRHGISAFLVARAISRKGLAARKYLQGGFENARVRVRARIGKAVKFIVEKR